MVAAALALSPAVAPTHAAEPRVTFDTNQAGQVVIHIGDTLVARYVYDDPQISRPYFAHLRPPGGPQVSRHHPPVEGADVADHPTFHPGLWMSFGDLSGNDYWRNKAAVKQVHQEVSAEGNWFAVRNRYLDQGDPSQTVCEARVRYSFHLRPAGYLLVWDSRFSSPRDFYFGDQEEMGLGFRVATAIRVEREAQGTIPGGNGRLVDSAGRVNGKEIWGNTAAWCDYSGTLDGQHAGMTLMCHPGNFRPSWFHARDYGLLLANAFGREAFGQGEASRVDVAVGSELRLRYGILVHASPAGKAPDLAREFDHFVQLAHE
jgi:hypothetical protein